jgi:hypothetical protein
MPHFTADAIRAHIGTPQSDSDRALLAIVDLCDALRIPSGVTTEARSNAANRIEGLIVRELGIPAHGEAEVIRPGQWVRWLLTSGELAPLAKWRKLDAIVRGEDPWLATLVFADGVEAQVHVDNLVIVDVQDDVVLWEVSDTKPEEAS